MKFWKSKLSFDSGGHRWAVMSRSDITDVSNPSDIYMTRWRLIQTPLFGVYLHCIRRPDGDRSLHDHPWSFATLVLRGGYVELYATDVDVATLAARTGFEGAALVWGAGTFHRLGRGEFHTIRQLFRSPTWTLVFVGPRRGTWGFVDDTGFKEWDKYLDFKYPGWRDR